MAPPKYNLMISDRVWFYIQRLFPWGRSLIHLRACLFAFKADLKARHQMHKLKRWYKCNESLIWNHLQFNWNLSNLFQNFKNEASQQCNGFRGSPLPALSGFVTDALPFKGIIVPANWITEMLALLQHGIWPQSLMKPTEFLIEGHFHRGHKYQDSISLPFPMTGYITFTLAQPETFVPVVIWQWIYILSGNMLQCLLFKLDRAYLSIIACSTSILYYHQMFCFSKPWEPKTSKFRSPFWGQSQGILVLIQHGRFTAEAQGASDMEEILASVHASMRETCTEHGCLGDTC